MSVTTFGFRDLTDGMGSPELAINQNTRINFILEKGVLAMDIATPPGSPNDADAYIVAATATGAWVGREDDIAYWFDESGVWKFIVPEEGSKVYVVDESADFRFTGSGGWDAVAGSGTVTEVTATGTVAGLTLSHTGAADVEITLGGTLSVDLTSMVTGVLPAANGGTGLSSLSTVASALLGLSNPTAIRFLRINADNSATLRQASDFLTDIGAGGSYTGGTGITLTGSAFSVDASVVYTIGGTDVAVTDGGTGRSTGTTAYALIATGTTATGAQQTLASGATTEILVGGGASALPVWTTATGTGAPVRENSPTLVTPALGTPSALVLTNATGLVTTTEVIAGYIATAADKTYKLVVKMPHAFTITEATTISESGTCTATFKINTTALGGTANSVSSSETSQAHASTNTGSAGDDVQLTVSSNSACLGLSFTLKYTRTIS